MIKEISEMAKENNWEITRLLSHYHGEGYRTLIELERKDGAAERSLSEYGDTMISSLKNAKEELEEVV